MDVIQANEVWEKICWRILGNFSFKKKKGYIGKAVLFFPLDIVMPSCDIYNHSSHLATKREFGLRTRTGTAEVKDKKTLNS